MSTWLSQFLSSLHASMLKADGFRKNGSTFSRDRGTYWERFNVQGSQWGTGDVGQFYLNVGVEFKELPPQPRALGLAHTHWAARVRHVVPSAPDAWRWTSEQDPAPLQRELAEVIAVAGASIASRLPELRQAFVEREARRASER